MATALQLPRMSSIWDEFVPQEFDFCDSDITDVMYPAENEGVFELTLDIVPYDEGGQRLQKLRRCLVAKGAYVFDPPNKDFVVNQALKRAYCYPEIIRMDIVTTGSLLRIECNAYKIENC